MAENQSIILITGGTPRKVFASILYQSDNSCIANSGIGFELASQLMSDPSKHVILCSRSAEKGEKALEEIKALGKPGSVEFLQLDVTDEKSIETAAEIVEKRHGRYLHL